MSIGERLRAERERLRYSQTDFGAALGVTKNSQGNYESGRRMPDAEYLQRADGLGVDVLFVVTGRPAPQPGPETDLLVRYRAADPAIRAAVTAALGTVPLPPAPYSGAAQQNFTGANIYGGVAARDIVNEAPGSRHRPRRRED